MNREPYELDPKMFAGSLPTYANMRSVRVAGGLGTIARIVVGKRGDLRASAPRRGGPRAASTRVYKPYHRALRELIVETHSRFGFAVLLDCHSMPSSVRGGSGRLRPDVVIGDRYGTSCAGELTDATAQCLTRLGYSVSRNKPYAGGFITEHYGQPARGLHAMQIEVNRCLYMDERTLEKSGGFPRLAADLSRLAAELARYFAAGLLTRPEAAE